MITKIASSPALDINLRDAHGQTAIMRAADQNFSEIIMTLLRITSIDINAQDHDGKTALILAAKKGHLKVVTELFKNPDIDSDRQELAEQFNLPEKLNSHLSYQMCKIKTVKQL